MAKDFLWGEEFKLDVSRGKVRGASVRNIFGNNDAQTSTFRAVWERSNETVGDYVFPTSALTMTINSNVADDGVVIKIIGLNSDYEEISELVTLNNSDPLNPPTTTNQFFRINDVITISGNAANNITIENGGIIYAQVDGGRGRNQAAIYTVPKDCTFYLYRIDAFTADSTGQAKPAKFRNFVTLSTEVQLRVAEVSFFNNMNIQRRLPFKYSEKTDIVFQMATFSATHPCSVFGEGIVVKELM